jgi:hypothetical protein
LSIIHAEEGHGEDDGEAAGTDQKKVGLEGRNPVASQVASAGEGAAEADGQLQSFSRE